MKDEIPLKLLAQIFVLPDITGHWCDPKLFQSENFDYTFFGVLGSLVVFNRGFEWKDEIYIENINTIISCSLVERWFMKIDFGPKLEG